MLLPSEEKEGRQGCVFLIFYFLLNRGKRGIKVTGALRSAGFQKIPARPQIVFNRFTGLNMLV